DPNRALSLSWLGRARGGPPAALGAAPGAGLLSWLGRARGGPPAALGGALLPGPRGSGLAGRLRRTVLVGGRLAPVRHRLADDAHDLTDHLPQLARDLAGRAPELVGQVADG